MKIYLDTNILVYMLSNTDADIDRNIYSMLVDCSNVLLTSSVCVAEFIHLRQIGKIFGNKKGERQLTESVVDSLKSLGITIVSVTEKNMNDYEKLPMYEDHRDPNDRLIIAQAISDRTALISSDHKFKLYEKYGLEFFFNKR